MQWFCVYGLDAEGAIEKRKQFLEEHVAELRKLKTDNRLLAAGPLFDENKQYCGSMLLVSFPDKKSAEKWFAEEAYSKAGVYREVNITAYTDAMPII
jgi:uncharacterized protein YciI